MVQQALDLLFKRSCSRVGKTMPRELIASCSRDETLLSSSITVP